MGATTADSVFDLYVIGGGINGVGIAVDAAGRGLKVGLCEKSDLAGATSSASSKLIHGGLRYLEHYEFRLVKEALAEREVLLKMAPHIAWPLRFCLPHHPQLRPAWMIRAGLFLYDNLSSRASLPGCKSVCFNRNTPLQSTFKKGFEYSDAWVDDARLVVLNAVKLRELGGKVQTRTELLEAHREGNLWMLTMRDSLSGQRYIVKSKVLVNAAGPWVQGLLERQLGLTSPRKIRLIKGSHIVVPRIHDESRAYILQNDDQRVVFVLPYEEQFSLIGTTDIEYTGDPSEANCSRYEIDYLCNVVNKHFKTQINKSDVVWTYAGVRPLCEDESDSPQAITRDYTIELNHSQGQAPLLSVFGGKLTTYRKLGEAAINKLVRYFSGTGASQTARMVLPGGAGMGSVQQYMDQLVKQYPWLSHSQVKRFAHCYGLLAQRFLADAASVDDLGYQFGAGLTAAEVDYLIKYEWACTAEDILWRRTKLGLLISGNGQQQLQSYISSRQADYCR